METLKLILDTACQVAVLFLMAGAGWWLFLHAKPIPGAPTFFERWAALKDDDQLMALAVGLMLVCFPLAVGVLVLVLVMRPTGYDTLIGSVITSLLSTGALGMVYFFTQGHAGKKAASALAEIAAEPVDETPPVRVDQVTPPVWLIELALKAAGAARAAKDFICTRWWPGWVAAGLLVLPLSCSYRALGSAQADLQACQAAAAAPKSASVEKGTASSSVRVSVHQPLGGAFYTPSSSSSTPMGATWPQSPCPDVVVEAGSQAAFSREETPAGAPVIQAPAPLTELWADVGYNLGPVAGPAVAVRLEHGRGAAWLSGGYLADKPIWGVGAAYCIWRH